VRQPRDADLEAIEWRKVLIPDEPPETPPECGRPEGVRERVQAVLFDGRGQQLEPLRNRGHLVDQPDQLRLLGILQVGSGDRTSGLMSATGITG
jgi:hypothetical protein